MVLIRGGRVKGFAGRSLSHPARRARYPRRQGTARSAARSTARNDRSNRERRMQCPAVTAPSRAKFRPIPFGDLVLTKFMNYVMYERSRPPSNIVYGALETVEKKMKRPSIEAFHDALGMWRHVHRSALTPRRRRDLSGAG